MTTGRQPSGVIELDGEPFFLMKDDRGGPAYKTMQVPTQEGDPTVGRRFRWNDWSRGMGDSRGIFRGAVEISSNAYLGSIGRILPGPKINTIATSNDAPIVSFVEVTLPANRVLAGGGRYVVEINPTTHAVATTADQGASTVVAGDMQLFIDQVAIPLGDATLFRRRNASGTYSNNTLTGNNRYARCFGLSVEGDLVRGRSYYWSKCSAADFYGTDGNWSTEYDVGNRSRNINKVGAFEGWDYVLKDEGFYSFRQDNSKEANLLPDLAGFASTENRQWFPWYNRLFLGTFAGLYRYIQQGGARTVGIEEEELNESALRNFYPTAGVAFGKWAYVALYDGTTTYIVMMRNARDGDATLGSPFTAICVIDSFTGKCGAMIMPTNTSTPEVWYGRGTGSIGWFAVSRDGQPAAYPTSGTTRVDFSPNDFGSPYTVKYFRRLQVKARKASSNRTITFKATMDEGTENTVGSAITALSGLFANVFWTAGSNDSGRIMKLAVEMVSNSASNVPEVRDVVVDFEERPEMVTGAAMVLRFRDQDQEGDVSSRKSALEMRQAVEGFLDGAPITMVDPYGESYKVAVAPYDGAINWQRGGDMPQDEAQIVVRRLDYS